MISSLDVRDVEFDSAAVDVVVNEDAIVVRLADGREISAPLAWYPRLLDATPEQRSKWQIIGGGYGINWEELDEDISVRGLLRIH
jgi:hypothetical protein